MSETWWNQAAWTDLRDWIKACQRAVGQVFSEVVRAPYRPYTQAEYDALPDIGSMGGVEMQTFTIIIPCPDKFDTGASECRLLALVRKSMAETVLPGLRKQTLSEARVARIAAVNAEVQMTAGLVLSGHPECTGVLMFRVLCLMADPVAN